MNVLPVDHGERERLRTELDRTFFVEAGAGTGKTTALVSRIVALVAAGDVEMEKLAAITFTEAAAAELRDRARRGLEKTAKDTAHDNTARERCRVAAAKIDLAMIQTIHAFAGTILRTFPIEAGLPPGFSVWDNVQSSLAFEERFRTWLYDEVLDDCPRGWVRRDAVRRVLLLGTSFEQLRDLARALQEQTDLLTGDTTWSAEEPPDAVALAQRWGEDIRGLPTLVKLARNGKADPLAREVQRLQFVASRMASARTEDDALAALQGYGQPKLNVGKIEDWDNLPDGSNPVRVIRGTFKSSRTEIEAALVAHRTATLCALLAHLRDFTLDFARDRREQGAATFHDLLTWTRDLLRDNPAVRDQARRRFDRIFVDEFQDTDPLQAEIVWLLAADPGAPTPAEWQRLKPRSGKLFVVGDPKQSIYRFRRADISLYSQLFDQAEGDAKIRLTQNFRSASPVLDWVNFYFQRDMQPSSGIQAEYVDLHPTPSVGLSSHSRSVHVLGGKLDGHAEQAWVAEAEQVAITAQRAVSEGWMVRGADGQLRPARYADVCVLMPGRTNVRRLEDAFFQHAVPYRIESGSLVLATQEVRDLLAGLRAIDDPSDQVALVAALRSPAYGCSDVDLLRWVEAGGKLDYEQPHDGLNGLVADALDSLRRFHAARAGRSPAATIEAFVRERMLAVQVFGQPRPREAWRRIRYVISQARVFAAAGRPTLRALVDWLEGLQRVGIRDPESPTPEADEDAVRLLTIHGAKGLEFPIVILTGLGAQNRDQPGSVQLVASRSAGTIEARCGGFQTPGYETAKETEKQMEDAEQIRLLYVAATRARDHLVFSLFHSKNGCHAARIAEVLRDYDPHGYHVISDEKSPRETDLFASQQKSKLADRRLHEEEMTPEEHARDEQQWLARRQAQIEELAAAPIMTASALPRLQAMSRDHAAVSSGTTGILPAPVDQDGPGDASVGITGHGPDGANHLVARAPRMPAPEDSGPRPPRFDDDEALVLNDDPISAASDEDEPTALGRAVHAVLEVMDTPASPGFHSLATNAAHRFRVSDRVEDVKRLATAAAESPIVRQAMAADRHWREVPVGVEVDGVLLLGRIDLLYEEPDSSLTIVDVKTDQVDRETVAERANDYRAQGGAYALAVEHATGQRVSSVAFVFAALDGHAEVYRDIPALTAEARTLIVSLGRPSVAG